MIPGGVSGIGEACARLFAEHGARVAIADLDDARAGAPGAAERRRAWHVGRGEDMAAAAAAERRGYDFIVVGAGSAGCVLANRLTEGGRWRVLLLEAGPKSHWLSPMPISFAKLIDNPAANWCYRSEPDEGSGGRTIPVPRGRLLGGSSAINGLVFVRGQRLDYDTWAQLGNRGWSYDDVLPVFRRMEHFEGRADGEWRARGGPLRVSEVPDRSPLYDALFRAGEEVGLPPNPDYNGAAQEGMCKTQATISHGRRMSTAHCYLRPARGRANLEVASGALARGLLLEGGGEGGGSTGNGRGAGGRLRCTGVRYMAADGREVEARAGREVVLCAGSVNSPQLLELSGIGRPGVLREHGIDVAHELPGVGENLIDHMAPRVVLRLKRHGATYNERAQGLGLAWQILRYAADGRGFLSLPSAPVLAFLRSRPGLEAPDVQVHFAPYSVKSPRERVLLPEPGMTCTTYVLRPESRGSIHVRSRDPAEAPTIRFNFLSDEQDRRGLVASVRWVRQVMAAKAMDGFRDREMKPGPEVESDDEIVGWIRATAETAFHPAGTCKMGRDPMAVVDERLRVHGVAGLRVADGSIMPTLVSGNTNAACIMIGEKASEMILAGPA